MFCWSLRNCHSVKLEDTLESNLRQIKKQINSLAGTTIDLLCSRCQPSDTRTHRWRAVKKAALLQKQQTTEAKAKPREQQKNKPIFCYMPTNNKAVFWRRFTKALIWVRMKVLFFTTAPLALMLGWKLCIQKKTNQNKKTPTFWQTTTKSLCRAAKAGSQSGAELS